MTRVAVALTAEQGLISIIKERSRRSAPGKQSARRHSRMQRSRLFERLATAVATNVVVPSVALFRGHINPRVIDKPILWPSPYLICIDGPLARQRRARSQVAIGRSIAAGISRSRAPLMSASIVVTDSAWTARTNAQGIVTFADAPNAPGRLTAWQPYLRAPGGELEQSIAPAQRSASFLVRLRSPRRSVPVADY